MNNYQNINHEKQNEIIKPIKDICFLFLTTDGIINYKIWENFFNSIDKKYSYSIYIHDKNKGLNLKGIFKDKLIPQIIPTNWGDISLVKATLLLLKYGSFIFNHKKYVLLCGRSVPLTTSNIFFEKVLIDDLSWFSIFDDKTNKRKEKIFHILYKNNFDKCSQWMILNQSMTDFFIKYDATKYFNCFAADEHYFIILAKAHKLKFINKTFMWYNIIHDKHNKIINGHSKTFDKITNEMYQSNLLMARSVILKDN